MLVLIAGLSEIIVILAFVNLIYLLGERSGLVLIVFGLISRDIFCGELVICL